MRSRLKFVTILSLFIVAMTAMPLALASPAQATPVSSAVAACLRDQLGDRQAKVTIQRLRANRATSQDRALNRICLKIVNNAGGTSTPAPAANPDDVYISGLREMTTALVRAAPAEPAFSQALLLIDSQRQSVLYLKAYYCNRFKAGVDFDQTSNDLLREYIFFGTGPGSDLWKMTEQGTQGLMSSMFRVLKGNLSYCN